MKRRSLTLALKREVVLSYRAGETPESISARLRVPRAAVERICQDRDRRMRR